MRKPYVNVRIIGAVLIAASFSILIYNLVMNSKMESASFDLYPVEKPYAQASGRVFKHYPAQYNQPKFLPYGRNSEIVFIIEGDKAGSGDNLIATFPGDPMKTELRREEQMSATLTGPKGDVEITPRGAALQRVSSLNLTKWIWDVEPKRPDIIILTLDVYALLPLDRTKPFLNENVSMMKTQRFAIPVTLTLWDETKFSLDQIDPVWKTVAGFGSGIGAVLVYFGWPKKKEKDNLSA